MEINEIILKAQTLMQSDINESYEFLLDISEKISTGSVTVNSKVDHLIVSDQLAILARYIQLGYPRILELENKVKKVTQDISSKNENIIEKSDVVSYLGEIFNYCSKINDICGDYIPTRRCIHPIDKAIYYSNQKDLNSFKIGDMKIIVEGALNIIDSWEHSYTNHPLFCEIANGKYYKYLRLREDKPSLECLLSKIELLERSEIILNELKEKFVKLKLSLDNKKSEFDADFYEIIKPISV
ncbi:hypothetical protein ODU63_003601 [Vibrio cholerae]|nr:hypothetical protein [Vibrio cholerae]